MGSNFVFIIIAYKSYNFNRLWSEIYGDIIAVITNCDINEKYNKL